MASGDGADLFINNSLSTKDTQSNESVLQKTTKEGKAHETGNNSSTYM